MKTHLITILITIALLLFVVGGVYLLTYYHNIAILLLDFALIVGLYFLIYNIVKPGKRAS